MATNAGQREPVAANAGLRKPTRTPRKPTKAILGPNNSRCRFAPRYFFCSFLVFLFQLISIFIYFPANKDPTKAHENPRQPEQANEDPRKPTKAHEGQRGPMATNAGQREPVAAKAGLQKPTRTHGSLRKPYRDQTTADVIWHLGIFFLCSFFPN
jgi:hypothetical protein